MISKVCFTFFVLCCVLSWESYYVLGLSKRLKEQEILTKLLDQSRYDKRVRPNGKYYYGKGPTKVNVNLYVRSFDMVDEDKMEYAVQLTFRFRQQWTDKRLEYDNYNDTAELRYLSLTDVSQIWIPDLFFSNEKTVHQHQLMEPNHYIRIFPDGEVLSSARITLTLNCPMIMKKFHFDTQSCGMRMASYAYTTDNIIFKWKKADPVEVASALYLPKFVLEQFTTDYCDYKTNTGVYSCIRVDFSLRRAFNPYLLNIYIPTNMIVIVAWLGSWLDRKAVTARLLICLTTLFVQALESSRFTTGLPTTKSIDVWIGLTHTFVFACLVEYTVVQYLSKRDDEEKAKEAQEYPKNEEAPLNDKHLNVEVQPSKKNIRRTGAIFMSRFRCNSQKVDSIFRIVFPITYVFFVIIYASS